MDDKLLELWGRFLLATAQGKRQADQFFDWMKTGPSGKSAGETKPVVDMDAIFKQFRKMYGLDDAPDTGADYQKQMHQTMRDFQESFTEFLSVMGLVPRATYLELVQKYETLKARCADQEETIRHLNALLKDRGAGSGAGGEKAGPWTDLMRSQGEIFQTMFTGFLESRNRHGTQRSNETNGKGHAEDDTSRSEPEHPTNPPADD